MLERGGVKRYQWKNLGNQYIAILTVNLINILAGVGNGWMTPMVPVLMAEDTPLISGPLTSDEISWISSSFSVGSMLGCFSFTWVTAFLDCKRSSTCLTIPALAFLAFIYYGNTFAHMVMGRIVSGILTGAVQSNIAIYTAEIANDNVRGKFGSMGQLSRYIGIVICFCVSSFLGYEYIPMVSIILPIAFTSIFICLPNTPQFYLRRNRIEEADKALKFYKGFKGETTEERTAIAVEFERIRMLADREKRDKQMHFSDFYNRHAMKGLLNAVMLALFVNISGNFLLLNYAIPLFKMSGSRVNVDYSTIFLGVFQLGGCICSASLSDKLGRKCLMVGSLIGSALAFIIFAIYSHLRSNGVDVYEYHWVPVASVFMVLFMASAGIVPLAALTTIEALPPKIRGAGLAVCLFVMTSTSIFFLKTFPHWIDAMGIAATLLIYGGSCAFGAVYVLLMVPEMKGKRIDDVRDNLPQARQSVC